MNRTKPGRIIVIIVRRVNFIYQEEKIDLIIGSNILFQIEGCGGGGETVSISSRFNAAYTLLYTVF